MSVAGAIAGLMAIATAMTWASKGVRALIASHRAAAPSGHAEWAQKWQWFALAALQVSIGVWLIIGPATRQRMFWWLVAGFGALLIWVIVTDVAPRFRSRLEAAQVTDRRSPP